MGNGSVLVVNEKGIHFFLLRQTNDSENLGHYILFFTPKDLANKLLKIKNIMAIST